MPDDFIFVLLGGPDDGLEDTVPMEGGNVPDTLTRKGPDFQCEHVYVLLGLADLQPTEGEAPRVEYTYSGAQKR